MEPARPVPPYLLGDITSAWYYCLHCRHSEATEYAIRGHVRAAHELEDASVPDDYTNGTHLRILIMRWEAWSLELIDRFEKQVESLRGAEDLALEVGAGLPAQGFPKLPKVRKPKPAPPHSYGEDDGA